MSDDPDLLSLADELYGLPLPEFTPARDARAKELKGTAPELAARVKALRKASVAAWVVNQLVRHDAAQAEQLLEVGAALREAQESLAADDLRQLTRQRRQLTAAVTVRARGLARERGVKVTPAVADQVEATLTAAMLDAGAAEAVRSGLLVAALAATGVDAVDVSGAVAVPEAIGFTASPVAEEPLPRPELHVVPDPEADLKARRAAQAALDEAESDLEQATRERDEAAAELSDLEARSMQLQSEIEEFRRRVATLEQQLEATDDELADAEDVRAEAEETHAEAVAARDRAAAALERLG
ncbi:hypothetical protein [Nocardioides sp.]|uniref:hypothetical protein n=1 Tax=Nocardioides sp. TaxID=35761 RepID=UPI002735D537|nr:hypothetical protein [Nocardioides sp.]MDP3894658.1 hypothetical protein [Nocardioides sp.]